MTLESPQPPSGDAMLDQHSMARPFVREKIIFGDPSSCWKKDPLEKELLAIVENKVLTWDSSSYQKPAKKNNNKRILASILPNGLRCERCNKALTIERGPAQATIEHTDHDPFHNCIHSNLLYCNPCNSSTRNRKRAVVCQISTSLQTSASISEKKKEITHTNATEKLREKIDYSVGSIEVQINGEAEIDYRRWVAERISTYCFIVKKQAIDSGAEVFGVNPTTTRRYLDKLTSDDGEYEIFRDPQLKKHCVRRKDPDSVKLIKQGIIDARTQGGA
ncbi:MAG: hypothetical protein ACYC7D_10435 [Nitrososphaerales archaeon]